MSINLGTHSFECKKNESDVRTKILWGTVTLGSIVEECERKVQRF